MKLISNQNILLIDELKLLISDNTEVFIASGFISINALFELNEVLIDAKGIKVILDLDPNDESKFAYDPKEYSQYFNLNAQFKATNVCNLIETKFQVRSGNVGGQKFIIIKNIDETHCFSIVPQDLNSITLGLVPSSSPIVLTQFEDKDGQYLQLFRQFWSISSKDLKASLLAKVKQAFDDKNPEYIYKYTLYHLFKNTAINQENEQRINKIGFKQTEIWKYLFNFQRDAVLGAIDKIETFGGCIIADSVGLGKTFEALAVIKYYQMRNDRVLVLAPKKLRDNWLVYSLNDVQNILSKDRLNFDVLNHTDLSRTGGYSGNINLESINWGNYDLVVIDESHNFRNNDPRRNTITRYQRLMSDIIKMGVKTKVLMLSATPVNTRMNDIKNQIAFITEQNDEALAKYGIASIEQTLRKAQAKFNAWLKSNNGSTASRESLINGLDGSYFKLLDLLTIARSRKHIEKYYDVNDIGKFPNRLAPINRHTDFDINGSLKAMDKVNDELNSLILGFYSPLSYVRDDKRSSYEAKYDITTTKGSVFKQIERENSLIHLMRVNLLKRLESSVHSFRLTLEGLLRRIDELLQKIELTNRTEFYYDDLDINEVDTDDDLLNDLLTGGKVKVLLQDMDLIRCKEDLLDDKHRLENLLAQTKVIDESRDAKLKELKELIKNKVEKNLNKDNKKVIVFSAFADTVKYLYDNLQFWALTDLKINSAMVTGGDVNKTNLNDCKPDLGHILINFSPLSKKRDLIYPDNKGEIDLLICTDCISEGQNLQDCDYLVNYDIHWNPVRIVQRFGRIDRIGSINNKIQLVNFFPNLELDTYIDLIGRVKGRMQILDVSATGDDNIIEEPSVSYGDLDYRKRQLKQMQSKVLDLEDIEGGISITDLTFNDFKIDAERLSNEEREHFELAPKGIYAITSTNTDEATPGVIFCFNDLNGALTDTNTYSATHPYSLCYINANGDIFVPASNPKKTLDLYKKLCLGHQEVLAALIVSFNKETKAGKQMGTYTSLLQTALTHIKGVEDELGIDTLAFAGGTKMSKAQHSDAFELVSYLIVK
ncbi:MAG: helicase-related protein [Bacteroidota bacterium]|nr:helicase-related protein [Bacteroidota bacterium]